MTQAANLAALGTNAGTTGILPIAGGGTAGTNGAIGFKNKLINGAMQVWQRGTTSTSTGYQTVDRWSFYADSSRTISQSTDVPTGYIYSASLSGTGSTGLTQKIESSNTIGLVGQSITVSFWLKQSTGAGTNAIALNLYYPTASDNYNATVQIGSTQNFTTTTSWAQYSATFTNLPSGVANGIQCTIVTTSGSAVVFLLTGVQLEVGTAATNFDVRSYGTELGLCQRYYQIVASGNQGTIGTGYFESSGVAVCPTRFMTAMRATPTLFAPTGTNFYYIYTASSGIDTFNDLTGTAFTPYSATVYTTSNVSGTAGQAGRMVTNNDASFVAFGAEL
jgi:hypothetical protein